ncbi:hypothetical protein [Flavobacterium sp.]|uniref:hypothetical protein n=1 Tax=Flavobacterium sp. TaxID=239 RepID=UPI00391C8071
MKKILLLSALFISFLTFAQVPQGISYQAIALNGSGNPVVSSNVRVKLSILDQTATGTVLYSETQLKTTTAQGLFNLTIGQGTVVSGVFNTINWGTNSKFLKVEMDVTGGTNYVAVGTTQLLSVPYAMAADSLVTSPGEGITLVSPNGTPYQLTVNDAGELSLPTSGSTGAVPNQLYLYGTFNSFNPATSLLFASNGDSFYGYKYLTSGSQIKFLADNNSNATVYGLNASQNLTIGGSAYTVPSNGYYILEIQHFGGSQMEFYSGPFAPVLINQFGCVQINSTYNTSTNTFSFIANGITTNNNEFLINYPYPSGSSSCGVFGDLLSDGTLDFSGTTISFPNVTTTPKNFRVDLIINFNGSATYTVTQI